MDKISVQIGENLQKLRKQKGMTIDMLSSESGVSRSMISEIERGIRNPSITVLWNIANSLRVPLNHLLTAEKRDVPVIYKPDPSEDVEGDGYTIFPLTHFDEKKKMEVYFREFKPGCETEASSHFKGVEEYVLVSSGVLTAVISQNEYTVSEGEVLHFCADRPHHYKNRSDAVVKAFTLMFYLEQ